MAQPLLPLPYALWAESPSCEEAQTRFCYCSVKNSMVAAQRFFPYRSRYAKNHREQEATGKGRSPAQKILDAGPSQRQAVSKRKGIRQAPSPDRERRARPCASLHTGAIRRVAPLSRAPLCSHRLEKSLIRNTFVVRLAAPPGGNFVHGEEGRSSWRWRLAAPYACSKPLVGHPEAVGASPLRHSASLLHLAFRSWCGRPVRCCSGEHRGG